MGGLEAEQVVNVDSAQPSSGWFAVPKSFGAVLAGPAWKSAWQTYVAVDPSCAPAVIIIAA